MSRDRVRPLGGLLAGAVLLLAGPAGAGDPTSIQIEVTMPVCGNSVLESGEVCDPPAAQAQCPSGSTCNTACECGVVPDSTSVSLQPGMNLVSIPFVADDRDVLDLLSSVGLDLKAVFAYDAPAGPWQTFILERDPAFDDLKQIDASRGFWIDAVNAATIATTGVTNTSVSYGIRAGWNLISYPTPASTNIADAFQDVDDVILSVHRFDASASGSPWTYWAPNDSGSTLSSLDAGFGYWVEASEDDLWRFDGAAYRKRLADLEVTSVLPDPIFPGVLQGSADTTAEVDLDIKIRNNGDRDAEDVVVRLYDIFEGEQVLLGTFSFERIGAGESVSITDLSPINFPHTFDFVPGQHQLRVEIDPNGGIAEEVEANNERFVSMGVAPQLEVAINQNPTSGSVPLTISFMPGFVGTGQPPYQYLWVPDDVDAAITTQVGPTFVFSKPGQRTVELAVTDARGITAVDNVTFTLGPNPATVQTDLQMVVKDVQLQSGTTIADVDVDATNTGIFTGEARATVVVFDRDDPSVYNETIFDGLINVFDSTGVGCDSGVGACFTVSSDALPNGNYTAQATVNPFGALPESDLTNNGGSKDFQVTGATQAPLVEITDVTITPSDTTTIPLMVGMVTQIQATVKNNGVTQRGVKALFYFTDTLTDQQRITSTGLDFAILEPGEEAVLFVRWRAEAQPQTTIHIDVVDLFSSEPEEDREVRASDSQSLSIGAYDFAIRDFQACSSGRTFPSACPQISEASFRRPVAFSAEIENLSPLPQSVNYRIDIDGTEVETGIVPNLAVGEKRILTAQFQNDASGTHDGGIQLKPVIGEGSAVGLMYDSDFSNNTVSGSYFVVADNGCVIEKVEVSPDPVLGEETQVIATFSRNNLSGTDFNVTVTDEWDKWDDSTPQSDTLHTGSVHIQGGLRIERQVRSYPWTPSQVGDHTVTVQCSDLTKQVLNDDGEPDVFVQPRLVLHDLVGPYPILGTPSWDSERVTDDSFDLPPLDLKRVRLWTRAEGPGLNVDLDIFNTSSIANKIRRRFSIEDDTGAKNEYTVKVLIDAGWFGLGDKAGLLGPAGFTIDGRIGIVPENTNPSTVSDPCSDGVIPCSSRVFRYPTADDIFVDILLGGLEATPYVGILFKVAFAVVDAITCESVFYNWWSSRPRAADLNKRARATPITVAATLETSERYDAFFSFSGTAIAAGGGSAYVDFYDHAPHGCDQIDNPPAEIQNRGIWIDGVTVRATAVQFHP